jgi:lactoylglutathione lyase
MKFKLAHINFNVHDLDVSLKFYKEMFGMKEIRRREAEDGSFIIVFLEDEYNSDFKLELTWLRDHTEKYDLGEQEYHLAFHVEDYEKVKKEHQEKGLICYNTDGKPYHFVEDPDGYWLEFIPAKR